MNMTKHEIFDIWAPENVIWSDWVKPVLFACMEERDISVKATLNGPEAAFSLETDTTLVVDLPGPSGVVVGMAAARTGYRPVPLYNALPVPNRDSLGGVMATVPNISSIMAALYDATAELKALSLDPLAPPAFLLDANRRGSETTPQPGLFDNRSVSFTTDFPSARFLQAHGVSKGLIVQELAVAPQADLAHTLLKWQQHGMSLSRKALFDSDAQVPLEISKPSHFSKAWHRVLLALRLRRDRFGGFGGFVPEPSNG
jgi:hypothetical protein